MKFYLLTLVCLGLLTTACNNDSQDLTNFGGALGKSAASGGTGDGVDTGFDGPDEPLFPMIQEQIFSNPKNAGQKCLMCHTGSGPGGFSLDPAGAFDELVNETSSTYSRFRVTPGDSAGSLIVQKLMGEPGVGGQMPATGVFYKKSDCEMRLLRMWIDSGAGKDIGKKEARLSLGIEFDKKCDAAEEKVKAD